MKTNFKIQTAFLMTILLQLSGCTTARYRYQPPATEREEAQLACETFAQSEADTIRGDSVMETIAPVFALGPLGAAIALGTFPVLYGLLKKAHKRDQARDKEYSEAIKACRNPDSQLAERMRFAGTRYYARKRYADAELLYHRALALQEQLPTEETLARILEDYGQLLWITDRRSDSQQMMLRARSIRAQLGKQNEAEAKSEPAHEENIPTP